MNNTCSDQELQQVKVLLENPDAIALLHKLMQEKDEQAELEVPGYDDELSLKAKNWEVRINERIATSGNVYPLKKVETPIRRLNVLRYAAVWAGILIVSAIVFWQINKNPIHGVEIAYIEKANTKGAPVKYVLPDSSEVYLGAGSKLYYPENFKGDSREIKLEGEAFFQVVHNTAKPFIIHTGNVQTRVLGTSFKVVAFNKKDVMVAVATGKVGVSANTQGQTKTLALLTPGLTLTWNNRTGRSVKGTVDIYTLQQWKSGELIIDEQPLSTVSAELKRRYGVQLKFATPEIASIRVSGTFAAKESITGVMDMLSFVGKFEYETADKKNFTLYKTE